MEIFSEQILRFRLALAIALLSWILDFSSTVRVSADLSQAASSWLLFLFSSSEDDDKEAFGIAASFVNFAGEESAVFRRFAAGCLKKSSMVFDDDDEEEDIFNRISFEHRDGNWGLLDTKWREEDCFLWPTFSFSP